MRFVAGVAFPYWELQLPIPSLADKRLAVIDNLAAVVMLRLRVWLRAGKNRSDAPILDALEAYTRAVRSFIEDEGGGRAEAGLSSGRGQAGAQR